MSNMQMGTRGLSSSDLTRLKRLRGAKSSVIENNLNYPQKSLNNTATKVFVLACIDPRYTAALEEYLLQILPNNTYDLFILAGAALGGNLTANGACSQGVCSVVNTNWQTALLDHIQVAITLHNVTEILVVDHLDCGAYKNCILGTCNPNQSDQTPTDHQTQFDILHDLIVGSNPAPGTGSPFYANINNNPTNGGDIFGSNFTGLYFDTPLLNSPNITRLKNYSNQLQTTEYFPQTSGAKVLVLGCIDPRYSALLSSFLVNYKDVQFIYDLFILAGASLGANQSYNTIAFPTVRGNNPNTTDYPNNLLANNGAGIGQLGINWGPTFFDHLAIAILLHQITEVWVFDHLDCGAYKAIKFGSLSSSDLDPSEHIPELIKLQGYISQTQPSLAFKGFIMDTQGNISKVVDDQRGVSFSSPKPLGASMNKTLYSIPRLIPKTTGGSRIRFTASQYTALKAFYSADRVSQKQLLNGKVLTVTRVCNCNTSNPKKQGLCPECS